MVFPFIWMLLTSFKTLPQLLKNPLEFLPNPWTFDNYVDAWNAVPFAQAYLNSVYIAVLVVVGTLITASMAGLRVRAHPVPRQQGAVHRVPRDADDPHAGHAHPVLPADVAARLGRLAPRADRARGDREPLRGVPDAAVRAVAAARARGGRAGRRRRTLAHLLEHRAARTSSPVSRALSIIVALGIVERLPVPAGAAEHARTCSRCRCC